MIRKLRERLDAQFREEILVQMYRMNPEVVQNPYGTKVVDKKEERIYWHLAHQRILHRFAFWGIMFSQVTAWVALWLSIR